MKVFWLFLLIAMILPATITGGQAQDSAANLTGNAERGKTLFTAAFKCASCHGTTGESGSPRLVPMRRTQADFIRFVQKPTANAMPAFGDQSPQALADVYAYIKSIPERTPPSVQSIPVLNDVLKTIP
ncbi:MAG TPA: cytochrome c [Terriglobia bacterium]|nr:cytochrome c [Terriglobia bacterium]